MLENQSRPLASGDAIEVEYRAADHGFFPELVRLTITLSALGIGFDLHGSGMVRPYAPGQVMVLVGKRDISGLEIHFFPAPLYTRLLSPTGRQPRFMKVIKKQINKFPPTHPIKLSNLQQLMARVVGDAFVSYYERHLDEVISIWNREDKGRWPPIWQFAWAMRNALAHDGRIYFKHNNHPGVCWRNLKFNYDDNGRHVLFDEITGVELILLMEELDVPLRKSRT